MPSLPRLRSAALAELASQLRFESPEAARRQLLRTEALALELLAESSTPTSTPRTFPLDYILFRITGFRSDTPSTSLDPARPALIDADALLADLPALAERLSAAARFTAADLLSGETTRPSPRSTRRAAPDPTTSAPALAGPWLDLRALSARWRIGSKTIERLRRRGLLARRVRLTASGRGAAARQALLFSDAAIRAFEASGRFTPTATSPTSPRTRAVVIAARAPRLADAERARLIRRALRYRRHFGWTLNQCAQRLHRSGITTRSLETIRRALLAHERASPTPVFDHHAPLTDAAHTSIDRARRAGGSAARLARAANRSRSAVYRIERDLRADRLRSLILIGPVGPLFDRADAAEVLLGPAPVRTGLGAPAPSTIADLVALADAMSPPSAGAERLRAVAICFLRFRAATDIAALPRHNPTTAALDGIETSLRWASRLKTELIRSQLPIALRSIRARLDGRGPDSLAPRGPSGGAALIHDCIGALIDAVDRFDPFKALASDDQAIAGRLAAPATIAINRALTRWLQRGEAAGTPAIANSASAQRTAAITLADWTLRVDPWQAWLEPPEPLVRRLRTPSPTNARNDDLLRARWCLTTTGGPPPRTLADLARAHRLTPAKLTTLERRAIANTLSSKSH